MATPTGVQALIRALRPSFRSPQEKVVFAVHAVLVSAGLRLLAVGEQAENPDPATTSSREEAPLEGWATSSDALGGCFNFLYAVDAPPSAPGASAAPPPPPPKLLLVKCLPLEASVLVNLMADPGAPQAQPTTVELDVARHAPSAADLSPATYQHLDELIQRVEAGLGQQVLTPAAQASLGASTAAAATTPASAQPGRSGRAPEEAPAPGRGSQPAFPPSRPEGGFDPLRDYSQPSRGGPPGYVPAVGEGDVVPPLGGLGGLGGPGPGSLGGPGGYGGMHMGPGNFPGRGRQPPVGPHSPGMPGHPGGARWDPIAPEGLQGWNPDDFSRERMRQQRPPGVPDPDIMQPGAGKGTDWDAYFG